MWQNNCCQDSCCLITCHKITGCQFSQTQIAGVLDWVDGYSSDSKCWAAAHAAAKHLWVPHFWKCWILHAISAGLTWRSASGPPVYGSAMDLSKLHTLHDESSSSQRSGPISTEQWKWSGYIKSVEVRSSFSSCFERQQPEPGKPVRNTTMHSTMMLLGILFGLLTQASMLPVKVGTKRKYFRCYGPFLSCCALQPG